MKQTILMAMLAATASIANGASRVLADFEDGVLTGVSWGEKLSIAGNPLENECNPSSKVQLCEQTGYGMISVDYSGVNLSDYRFVSVDIFISKNAALGFYDGAENQSAGVEGKKWTRCIYSLNAASAALQFGQVGEDATYYIDNVTLWTEKPSSFSCDGLVAKPDVDYAFGQVAMGGGGFVSGIIAEGEDKYARTDVGGLYKWDRSNCSWKLLTAQIPYADRGFYSIESMAIDPQNPKNLYALVGNLYLSEQRAAILRSTDGGNSWKTINLGNLLYVHGNGTGRNCGERIAVDPNNSDIVICGGRYGNPLIISKDGGKNWDPLSTFPQSVYSEKSVKLVAWSATTANTTPDNNGITSVCFDPTSISGGKTQRIFVGASVTGADNLFVSEDGGETWEAITIDQSVMPLRLKMDGSGKLIVVCSNKCAYGSAGKIYSYDIKTKSAKDISPKYNGSSPAFGDCAVSPKDSKKLVAVTNNTWVPQVWENGTSANGDIIWTSTDGGETWNCLFEGKSKFTLDPNGVTWVMGHETSYALHWCGSAYIDPVDDNKASFVSGNGIFSSNNIWEDRPTIYFDVQGLEETVVLDAVSVKGGNLLTVIGDYTGFIHENVGEYPAIHDPAPGTTGGIAAFVKDSKVMMRVANDGLYITTTGHGGWQKVKAAKNGEGKCAITKKGDNLIFLAITDPGESGISYSTDNGATWTSIAGTSSARHIFTDPANIQYVYAGTATGVLVSSDYGMTWTETAVDKDADFTRICTVTANEGLIYVPCGSKGLAVSEDNGKTFTKVNGVTECLAVGSGKGALQDSYYLYLFGTVNDNQGIFRSTDMGHTWQLISDSKHIYGGPGNGAMIIGDENVAGRFYMSTLGHGLVYGEEATNHTETMWTCPGSTENPDVPTYVEESLSSDGIAYPNPSSSSFTLAEGGSYEVINVAGMVIERGAANAGDQIGDSWTSGIYMIKINGKVARLIKTAK